MRNSRQLRLSSGLHMHTHMHMHLHIQVHLHTHTCTHRETNRKTEWNSLKVHYEPGVVAHIHIPHTQEERTNEHLRRARATW